MGPIVFVTIVLAGVFNPEEVDKAPVYAKRSPSPGFGRSDGEKPVIRMSKVLTRMLTTLSYALTRVICCDRCGATHS